MNAVAEKTETVIYTEDVAKAAREFARENGIPVGTRGRLSVEHFTKYFLAQPRKARDLAKYIGVEVSKRGRLSEGDATTIALHFR